MEGHAGYLSWLYYSKSPSLAFNPDRNIILLFCFDKIYSELFAFLYLIIVFNLVIGVRHVQMNHHQMEISL